MNDHQPIKWQAEKTTRRPPAGTRHRALIGFLAAIIVLVMIAWFGFLGWGMFELVRSLVEYSR
jgi:hypothetical protein